MSKSLVIQAAMVTPITPEFTIDYHTLNRLIERLISHHGLDLSILGSTGEGALAPQKFRAEFREAVMERVQNRCTVYTGVLNAVPSETLDELRSLEGLGIAGALVPPPFYYRLNDTEIQNYFEMLADQSPVPLMLYNIPPYTKLSLPPHVVSKLSDHPNIMGIKDSSKDFEYFLELRHAVGDRDDFHLLVGADTLIASSIQAGGDGTVCAIANLAPEWVGLTCLAALDGNPHGLAEESGRLAALAYLVRSLGGVAAWKYGVQLIDGGQGSLFAPFEAVNPESAAAERLKQFLQAHHLAG